MMSKFFTSLSLLLVLFLTACATQTASISDWPRDIPPRAYFVAVYDADQRNQQVQTLNEYLVWVKRYYHGWELYRRGWNDVTEDLVTQMEDPVKAEEVRTKMDSIGRSIAGEWSKKSKSRKIFTRQVAIWGNALVESMNRGEELKLLNAVSGDVNGLLARQIPTDAITDDRYYLADENDIFR